MSPATCHLPPATCHSAALRLCLFAALLLLLGACRPAAGVEDTASNAAVLAATPLQNGTSQASPAQSAESFPSPPPTEMPAFALVKVEPASAGEKGESAIEAKALPTTTAAAGPTLTPQPTFAPQPTYTPPVLPNTSPDDHYWLSRPIPEGGTVWTDKAYPYGGTRGGKLRPHHGVEFYVPTGTEVLAAASGTVIVAGTDAETVYGPHTNFYGNLIVIELDATYIGRPVYNLYAHLSQVLIAEGQHVEAGEVIALSGATGVADGAHLHLEVRVGENAYGNTRNPLLWLYPFPDHGTLAGRVIGPGGQLIHGKQVFLRRIDAPSKYAETTTYANEAGELNADEGWGENFSFDDVVAGYYEVEVRQGAKRYREEVWVYPYSTSFVEVVIGG